MMVFLLSWIGMGCWIVCFWWMHRISSRQDSMLKELHAVTARIERLSRVEHDLIKEVHPTVSEIKDRVQDMQETVASDSSIAKR